MLRKTLTTKTTPRTVFRAFRACSCMTFEKNICYEEQKNYVKILMVLNSVLSCTIPLAGKKGTKLLFARNCNMSIFFDLGPLNVSGSVFEVYLVSLWYRLHFRRTFCQV